MTVRRKSQTASPLKKEKTQSSIFTSLLFSKKSDGKRELVELSDDSDIEIVQEAYDNVTRVLLLQQCAPVKEVDTSEVKLDQVVEIKKEVPETPHDDDSVIDCPICGLDLAKLTLSERTVHVDDCFNFGLQEEKDFQLTTKTGYVYKSMKSAPLKRCAGEEDEVKEGKKPKREKNPIPSLKIMDFKNAENEIVTQISMDAFCYKKHDKITHYFLSHFHSDHYMGITKSWDNGQIFCSLITKRLLISKFKVNENLITHINFNEPITIPDTQVKVTMLDANHCPGSAIFLFENLLTEHKVLHCGDFRINNKMIMDKHLYNVEINDCYLDTTYLNPTYAFPKQEHVISVVSDFCNKLINGDYSGKKLQKRVTDFFDKTILHKNKKSYLICVGTYTIGKERIAIEIARKLGVKLYANLSKREILSTFDWEVLNELLTDNPLETQVHLIPMRYLNSDSLESYFQPYRSHFHNIIAFRPTGWSFISNGSLKWMNGLTKNQILMKICQDTENDLRFNLEKIERQFKSDKVTQLYAVPYSEHSSFRELSFFCILLKFKRVIPTVNTHNMESIREMELWINEWKQVKEQNLLSIDLL